MSILGATFRGSRNAKLIAEGGRSPSKWRPYRSPYKAKGVVLRRDYERRWVKGRRIGSVFNAGNTAGALDCDATF
jgi:hypothetical protein